MAKLTTIYWRDIPAQVVAKQGRTSVKKQLNDRFAQAIDRAAMRAGKGSSDAYLEEWRRQAETIDGDMESAVADKVSELEAALPPDQLLEMIRRHGFAADSQLQRDED